MSELPRGWIVAPLVEVCEVIQDCEHRTPKYSEAGVPALRPRDVVGGRLNLEAAARVIQSEYELQTRRYAPAPGDVAYSRELSLGWAAKLPAVRVCLSQGMVALKPGSVAADYLVHFLNGPGRAHAVGAQAGSAHPHLNLRDIRAMPLPVAPLAEQGRIITAIEEAFSKLDAGEAGLRTVRQLLKRMREAVLAAAVGGRIVPQDTADIPATNILADLGIVGATGDGLPNGWARARVGDVARVGSGTTPQRGNTAYWQDATVPWVTSGLITKGIIREAREFVTLRAVSETSLRLWPRGTLLVAMYGEGQTRGRCAELGIDATCNQACAAIVLHDGLRRYKDFVRLFFDANYLANRRLASGGVQPNLNAGLIKDMVLELPPLEEQARIVAEVERHFSFIEACECAVDTELARAGALRRSVLKAAFEGRLVPQDSSDEPASLLMKRIQADRAASNRSTGGHRRKGVEAL